MSRIYTLVAVLFFVVAPIRFVYCLQHDLAHPETWDQDWTSDPRIYLPLAAATAVFMAGAFLYCLRVGRRTQELERQRLRQELLSQEEGKIQRRGE